MVATSGKWPQTSRRLPTLVVNDKGRYRRLPGRPAQGTSFQRFRRRPKFPSRSARAAPKCRSVITLDAENDPASSSQRHGCRLIEANVHYHSLLGLATGERFLGQLFEIPGSVG